MKQFATILKFELKTYFQNKIFIGITIFLVLAIGGTMFSPRIINEIGSGELNIIDDEPSVMLLKIAPELNADTVFKRFQETFPTYEVKQVTDSAEEIRKQVVNKDAECALDLHTLTSYTYYVQNRSLYDQNTANTDEIMKDLYRRHILVTEGKLTEEQVNQILSTEIKHETEELGKDQAKNFFYTYIMVFALYMVIMLYGQMVATNVASEKSSRAMELLVTSAKPASMMFGKVIASCLAGLFQIICVFGSSVQFFQMNKTDWEDNFIMNSIFNIPASLLVYMIVFFILGFFLYAFLYGAVGSTVSKMEDVNTAVMPITFLFIFAFFAVMISMNTSSVDNGLMLVCSYLPFTSSMAMFTRIAMSAVSQVEIIVSIVILLASVVGIGVLSAKIYRVGVLLYGTKPNTGTVLKSIWKA